MVRTRRIWLLVVAISLVVIPLAAPASATPGDLDTSFGGDGIVTTNFSHVDSVFDTAFGVAVQTDGKIVAAGRAAPGRGTFGVVRYNTDGSPDATFSGDGKLTTNFTPREDFATDVAVQSDGRIVAAGRAGGGWGRFAVARYNTNGTLDASFSDDGKVATNFTRKEDIASALAIQADGKIVVVGVVRAARYSGGSSGDSRFGLLRYNTDGSLDTTFGGDGRVVTNLPHGREAASAVAIQADGKIVVAGEGGAGGRFALVRYNSDGSLDATFGGDGEVTTDFTHPIKPRRGERVDLATSVAIQPDGRIVAAGTAGAGYAGFGPFDSRFALVRYNTDGTLDAGFGGDGKVTTNLSYDPDYSNALAIQVDGKIVVVGTGRNPNSCCESYNVGVRYSGGGLIDSSFSGDGKIATDYVTAGGANDVAIQLDGNIVVAGVAGVYYDPKFEVIRYLGG